MKDFRQSPVAGSAGGKLRHPLPKDYGSATRAWKIEQIRLHTWQRGKAAECDDRPA